MTEALSPSDIPKKAAERRLWMKSMLRLRGYSMRAFALEIGVAPQTVAAVIEGRASFDIEDRIARLLGLPMHLLFPERYNGTLRIARVLGGRKTAPRVASDAVHPSSAAAPAPVQSAGGR